MKNKLERAISFLRTAKTFCEAASIIAEHKPHEMNIVVNYLYGHALELALKSILIKNNVVSEGKLKEIGHDLEKALEKANACPERAVFDQHLQDIISILNPEYQGTNLKYPCDPGDIGLRLITLPCVTDMQESVGELIRHLDARYKDEHRQLNRRHGSLPTSRLMSPSDKGRLCQLGSSFFHRSNQVAEFPWKKVVNCPIWKTGACIAEQDTDSKTSIVLVSSVLLTPVPNWRLIRPHLFYECQQDPSVSSHLNLRARGVGVWQFAAHDASTRFKCPYPKI